MKHRVKKLYRGYASIRDYIVKKAIDKQEPLEIEYDGHIMTVPNPAQVLNQLHSRKFQSKFTEDDYELYDFKWRPDEDEQCVLFV